MDLREIVSSKLVSLGIVSSKLVFLEIVSPKFGSLEKVSVIRSTGIGLL